MPSAIEAEIGALMKTHSDSHEVANALLERSRRNLLSNQEQDDVFQFMIDAGLYTKFFDEMSRLIGLLAENEDRDSIRIPWGKLIEALGRSGVHIEKQEFKAIFAAAKEGQASADLVQSHLLDSQYAEFAKLRENLLAEETKARADKKQSLKNQLDYMRANRMFEQEAKILDEIQALFPEEKDIQADRESHDIRWAREIVSNYQSQGDLLADLRWRVDRLNPELTETKKLITKRAFDLAQSDSQLAYDLAVSLHLMDFNNEAIEILSFANTSCAADWLKLELMIRARKFVNALDEASRLELIYADDPEASFTAIYARARALHGLGHRVEAIDLLRSLVRIRPNYKSAQSLLLDWSEGDL